MGHSSKYLYGHRSQIESNRVNVDEEDELLIEGYAPSIVRSVGLVLLCLLTGGFVILLCSWRPCLRTRIANRRCCLEQAQLLILRACADARRYKDATNVTSIGQTRKGVPGEGAHRTERPLVYVQLFLPQKAEVHLEE